MTKYDLMTREELIVEVRMLNALLQDERGNQLTFKVLYVRELDE